MKIYKCPYCKIELIEWNYLKWHWYKCPKCNCKYTIVNDKPYLQEV